MPNWCYNKVEITSTPENIERFRVYLKNDDGKDWMSYFLPIPEAQKENWYNWNLENYGCKWNCVADSWEIDEKGEKIKFSFDSPWAPPSQFYERFYENYPNYDIKAYFHEEGTCLVGYFEDGFLEEFTYSDYEVDLDGIPDFLVEMFDLRHYITETEDE